MLVSIQNWIRKQELVQLRCLTVVETVVFIFQMNLALTVMLRLPTYTCVTAVANIKQLVGDIKRTASPFFRLSASDTHMKIQTIVGYFVALPLSRCHNNPLCKTCGCVAVRDLEVVVPPVFF